MSICSADPTSKALGVTTHIVTLPPSAYLRNLTDEIAEF